MPKNDNVTALLYRRRESAPPGVHKDADREREMAFDPLLVFTAVLVAGAVVTQLAFLLALEF